MWPLKMRLCHCIEMYVVGQTYLLTTRRPKITQIQKPLGISKIWILGWNAYCRWRHGYLVTYYGKLKQKLAWKLDQHSFEGTYKSSPLPCHMYAGSHVNLHKFQIKNIHYSMTPFNETPFNESKWHHSTRAKKRITHIGTTLGPSY